MASDLFKFKFSKSKPASVPSGNMIIDEEKITLSDGTFIELRDIIYKLCGIYYTESKKYLLEGRILKRITSLGLKTYEQYISYLQSPSSRAELDSLFEAITINETYFFRAQQQFDVFESIIVPEIAKPKMRLPSPTFRVWSAASSSGEEAYTLAILFLEKIKPMFPGLQFQIVASDINQAVLDNAKKGIYKEYSVRNIPPDLLNKYFKQQGNTFLISDEVKKFVRFFKLNLYDTSAVRAMAYCDVIFCCNVLIYFDVPSKQLVVSNLYDVLNKGGYLFIGYSESLHGISKAFKLIHLPKAMAYKKE